MEGSHWVNMEVLVKELHSRGHQLSVIRQSKSWFVQERSPYYTSIPVKLVKKEAGVDLFSTAMHNVLEGRRKGPFAGALAQVSELSRIMKMAHRLTCGMLSTLLEDKDLMAQLRDDHYDLMLTDPGMPAGTIVAHYLNLPLVYNVRWTTFGEGHFSIAPSPISYVPVPGTGLTDHMGLLERAHNFLYYSLNLLQERWLILPIYNDLLRHHFPPGANIPAMQYAADLWLMRVDFVFEFPRPSMPNLVYIGGFQCHSARELPAELEAFMQSSGEAGVVIMSLGTLITALPQEVTEAIALAFAQLPQKVVWRFVGKKPSTLGNNTLLMQWMPQSDLLGHPKTRAFVAHGGTNGLYEAIYHGVPVLGLPLLFDQMDNVVRLEARGAARMLDAATLTAEGFLEALREILENPSYRLNMQKLSRLHRDQPMRPLDKAAFWVEYVIRHKGVPHLRTEAYTMPFYSYYSLDVAALLLSLPLLAMGGFLMLLWTLICRKDWKTMKYSKKKILKENVVKENCNILRTS
ncbi:UDP glucuronosyltransferase 5 family, polypeptide G2 [Colossoma macropomum]|uniref:UDP glucuronosyltransferase 5 family, polypeptide G2 n=1 Tax=Colossoma macropomum TaxID=42526 RepID=UPI001863F198|nr:UDP glucuronosyltransferase 5 family, polypeptide G2 [Colossoma macropomum]